MNVKYGCNTCSGKGELYYPKSPMVAIATHKEITWSYSIFKIKVVGTADYQLFMYHAQELKYTPRITTGIHYWLNPPDKEYPVIIKLQGRTLQVIPKNAKGERIATIVIDARSGYPTVFKGTEVKGDFGFEEE